MNFASPLAALPERFNWLESMLFAPRPGQALQAAERYVGHLLSQPVAPPMVVQAPILPEPAGIAALDL